MVRLGPSAQVNRWKAFGENAEDLVQVLARMDPRPSPARPSLSVLLRDAKTESCILVPHFINPEDLIDANSLTTKDVHHDDLLRREHDTWSRPRDHYDRRDQYDQIQVETTCQFVGSAQETYR